MEESRPSKKDGGHDSPPKGYPKSRDQYADPENWKYPIDTEEHVRAAWSYIHQKDNQKGYSSGEIAYMKARIRRAAAKFGIELTAEADMLSYQLQEDDTTSDLPPGVIRAVKGRAGTADVVNANKRKYPASVYRKAVRDFNAQDPDRPMLGELDHSFGGQLEKTAMRITGLSLADSRHLNFTAHILDTPDGRTLNTLLEAGIPINVSTRGYGSMIACCEDHMGGVSIRHASTEGAHEPHMVVDSDYELHGIDAVSRGASKGARISTDGANRTNSPTESENFMDQITEQSNDERGPTEKEMISRCLHLASELEKAQNELTTLQAAASQQHESLKLQLDQATKDIEVLQSAAQAERVALTEAMTALQSELAQERVTHESAVALLNEQLAEANSTRDSAVEALNKIRVEEQSNSLLSTIRPDIRRKVAEQLGSCSTPEEVTERWQQIEQVLSAAGMIPPPAGSGRSDNQETRPQAGLTPEQRLQRMLLGIS